MPEWITYVNGSDPNVLATFELTKLVALLVREGLLIVVYAAFALLLACFGMCLQASLHHLAQPFAPLDTLVATTRRRMGRIAHIFWDLLLLQLQLVAGSRWHH